MFTILGSGKLEHWSCYDVLYKPQQVLFHATHANVRLGSKSRAETNTLAYCSKLYFTKKFYSTGPRMSLSKSKCWYTNNCLYLLKCAVPLILCKRSFLAFPSFDKEKKVLRRRHLVLALDLGLELRGDVRNCDGD